MRRPWLSSLLVALLLVVAASLTACNDHSYDCIGVPGGTGCGEGAGLPTVDGSALPAEAQTVLKEITDGGPFEYPGKDGSVFNNYEGLLPQKPRGCYHEYTVDTPGSSSRGARRIITGCDGNWYWTSDHYEHFAVIAP